jgi:hypothetical protein
MLRRAFVLLQLEAACNTFDLLVWTVPTPINKNRHLFVLIYLFNVKHLLYAFLDGPAARVCYPCLTLCHAGHAAIRVASQQAVVRKSSGHSS